MSRYPSILTILFIAMFATSNTFASTCSIDNTGMNSGSTALGTDLAGQQFIACESGTITSIQVNTSGGDIHLYLAAGNGSTGITPGSPTQIFTGQAAGLVTLNLANPFSVTKGGLYAFAIGNVTNIIFDNSPTGPPANDTAPDGRFSFEITPANVFTENTAADLVFKVNISIPFIPTMSQWGLFIFALIMLNLGLVLIRGTMSTDVTH